MKNNRLLLSWVIALGLVAFGVLANWYLVFVWAAQPLTTTQVLNPYQSLYDDLLYPSVRITTADSIGSGVILSNEQVTMSNEQITQTAQYIYILTAAHVVGNEALVNVELFNSTESLPAFVVLTDTGKDLALLRCASVVTSHASSFVAKLAPRSYTPYVFTPIWVVGCSLGYSPRPTEGCITVASNHGDTENTEKNLRALSDSVVNYWEMNAPIWPGNSGGGVFLKDTHELIGIAVWVKICHGQLASTMGGIVPLQTIYEFLKEVKSYAEKESD